MNRRESFRAMIGMVLAPSAAVAASAHITKRKSSNRLFWDMLQGKRSCFSMREDGFLRQIMPQIPLTDDQLDRQVQSGGSIKIFNDGV